MVWLNLVCEHVTTSVLVGSCLVLTHGVCHLSFQVLQNYVSVTTNVLVGSCPVLTHSVYHLSFHWGEGP